MGKSIKFYAVARGRETGIFDCWEDCRAQTEGFQGAVFKSFFTLAEANAWLDDCNCSSMNPEFNEPPSENEVENSSADYVVFTDGSCLKNPGGAGGYAAIIINNRTKEQAEYVGGEASTTNNRMELLAALVALQNIPQGSSIDFYTDSQYLQNAFTRCWLQSWKRQGWLASNGNPVKNQDLWVQIDALASQRRVKFHWVKGHAGNPLNELCDKLAYDEAMRIAGCENIPEEPDEIPFDENQPVYSELFLDLF